MTTTLSQKAPRMTTAIRNRHFRQLANEIAAEVSQVIGLRKSPKCFRITKLRGHGNAGAFSVPCWAATSRSTQYFIYYVAHEVCHAHPLALGHGSFFKKLERKACAHFGLQLVLERKGRGPYLDALLDSSSGEPYYVKQGLVSAKE